MKSWVYAAWFRNHEMTPGDQDYEWVACILINAVSKSEAQEWGDHLAHRMTSRNTKEEFLWSEVRSTEDSFYENTKHESLPVVDYGIEVTDEQIGW